MISALRLAVGLTVVALLAVLVSGLPGTTTNTAHAGSLHKCKNIKKVRKYKVKKIKVTRPISCKEARSVTKKWVERKFNQNYAIARSGRNWFCTWHRRDPKSVDTGSADCEAGSSAEIRYVVHRR